MRLVEEALNEEIHHVPQPQVEANEEPPFEEPHVATHMETLIEGMEELMELVQYCEDHPLGNHDDTDIQNSVEFNRLAE